MMHVPLINYLTGHHRFGGMYSDDSCSRRIQNEAVRPYSSVTPDNAELLP